MAPWTPYDLRHACLQRVEATLGKEVSAAYGGHDFDAHEHYEGDRAAKLAARAAMELG